MPRDPHPSIPVKHPNVDRLKANRRVRADEKCLVMCSGVQVTEEGNIECLYHGWQFEGAKGTCVKIPQVLDISPPHNNILLSPFRLIAVAKTSNRMVCFVRHSVLMYTETCSIL